METGNDARSEERYSMGYVPIQIENADYSEEIGEAVLHITGYARDGSRHYVVIHGEGIYPSFGVPYEEFWLIKDDPRIVDYWRGPDSPLGEPVMEVRTKLPSDIGTGQDALRNYTSHSYQGDIKYFKKCLTQLGFFNGYFQYDDAYLEHDKIAYHHPAFKVHAHVHTDHVKPLPDSERFFAQKTKVYWDTEWDMSELKNEYGEFRGSQLDKNHDWKRSRMITVVFYEFKYQKYVAFTWHPLLRKEVHDMEDYISRIDEKIRNKINIPEKYTSEVNGFLDESTMFDAIIEYLHVVSPGCLLGYNSAGGIHGKGDDKHWINGFDMPYFFLRAEHLKKPVNRLSPMGSAYKQFRKGWEEFFVNIKLVTQFDLWHSAEFFDITWKDYWIKNKKLDTLMYNYLGIGKVKHIGHVWEQWLEDPYHERYYCTGDVEGTFALDVMFNMSEDGYNRAMMSGTVWEDYQFASKLHDQINLRLYKDLYFLDTKWQKVRDIATGHKIKTEEHEHGIRWRRDWITNHIGIEVEKKGGYVPVPIIGLHEGVVVIDFNKFYPNSAMAANCGPETFVNVKKLRFKKADTDIYGDAEGVRIRIPNMGIEVVELRPFLRREIEDWEEEMRKARAAVGNNVYDLHEYFKNELIEWKEVAHDWNDLNRTPSGFFLKTPTAKNTIAFEELLRKRKEMQKLAKDRLAEVGDKNDWMYKVYDLLQFSFKGLTNARFGITGMMADRLYMLPIFNTFTLVAQTLIRECIRYMEEDLEYTIVGGDTDSVFIKLKKKLDLKREVLDNGRERWYSVEADTLCNMLNKHVWEHAQQEFNFDRNTFNMDVEDISGYFYIHTKKHYVKAVLVREGVKFDHPVLMWKGLKRVSRSTSLCTDDIQDALGAIILKGGTLDDAIQYIMKIHEEFNNYEPMYLCKVLPLKRPLSKYSKNGETWKAYTLANQYFNAGYGLGARAFIGRLKYCPPKIKGRKVNPQLGDVIAFDERMLPEIKEAGLVFDYDELEDKAAAAAANELLARFDTSYWDVLEDVRTYDPWEF